jgi:hypothetical protein
LSEAPKFKIEIEAIKTPKGLVPTVESLRRIVEALNVLDADFNRMNLKMEANIRALLREVKTLQKLVADDTIASESSVEKLGILVERLDSLEKNLQKEKRTVSDRSTAASLKALKQEITPTLTKASKRLEQTMTLFERRLDEFLRELKSSILLTVRQATSSSTSPKSTSRRRSRRT